MEDYIKVIIDKIKMRDYDFVNKLLELNILDGNLLTKEIIKTKDYSLYVKAVLNLKNINYDEIVDMLCNSYSCEKLQYLLDIAENNNQICRERIIESFIKDSSNVEELYDLQMVYRNDKRIIKEIINKARVLHQLFPSLVLTNYKDEDLIRACIAHIHAIDKESLLMLLNIGSKYSIDIIKAMVNNDEDDFAYMVMSYFNLLKLFNQTDKASSLSSQVSIVEPTIKNNFLNYQKFYINLLIYIRRYLSSIEVGNIVCCEGLSDEQLKLVENEVIKYINIVLESDNLTYRELHNYLSWLYSVRNIETMKKYSSKFAKIFNNEPIRQLNLKKIIKS